MTRKYGRIDFVRFIPNIVSSLLLTVAFVTSGQTTRSSQHSPSYAPESTRRDAQPPHQASRKNTAAAVAMNSDPLFLPPVAYGSGGSAPNSITAADVNGDGKMDLIVANEISGNTGVLLGNGDGTFGPAAILGAAGSVAVADLNGDGKPDIVTASGYLPVDIYVLIGNGDGTFQPPVSYYSGGPGDFVAIADVNGDGKPDLVVANSSGAGTVGVLLGNGDGTFQPAVVYPSGGIYSSFAVVADVNGDGKPDILVANLYATGGGFHDSVGVLLGNGDGTFQPPAMYDGGGAGLFAIAVADLNGDGKLDIVTANFYPTKGLSGHGVAGVLIGNGNGTFQPPAVYDTGGFNASSVAISDVNGDGKPDMLVTTTAKSSESSAGSADVFLGNGDGTFQPAIAYAAGQGVTHIAVADVNNDGRPDMIVANTYQSSGWGDSVNVVLNNTGPHTPTTTTLTSSVNPVNALAPVTFSAAVAGKSGETVTGTVAFQDGAATIATVVLAGGQAAYTTSFKRSSKGVHTITALYSGDYNNSVSTSAPIAEDVLVPSHTTVTTSLSPAVFGETVTFTAFITSQYGAIPDGESVSFSDGGTTIGSGTTAGGTCTLTTSLLNPATHDIEAAYLGDSMFEASSGTVFEVVGYTTSTSLTSSLNPSVYGQSVTFTAKVSTVGSLTPTGTVIFNWSDGVRTFRIGSAQLDDLGIATLSRSNLSADPYPVTAVYNGDAKDLSSTSLVLNQMVSQTTSSATISSSLNPSPQGQAVTFTANLISPTVKPTGPVTFSAGTTVLGTVQLSGGKASYTTTSLPAGSTLVKVTYNGDSNINGSSATVTQVVQP
jgi:hypothetical protein